MDILQVAQLVKRAQNDVGPKALVRHASQWYEPYYTLFYLCAQVMKGKGVAVELGVDQGRGSLAFVLGGMETIGVDHTRKVGVDFVDTYEQFTFLESDTLPVPDYIRDKKIAMLHVDTEHTYSMAHEEFTQYKPYLIDGAIVFFDDLHAMDDAVMEYFLTLPYQRLIVDEMHDPCGFGLIIYST